MKFLILLVAIACAGCAEVSSKPRQDAATTVEIKPVVTGDAATITTKIDSVIEQTQNSVIPWLIGLGIVALFLCGVITIIVILVFRAIRQWSYVGSFEKIMELKARACKANGPPHVVP